MPGDGPPRLSGHVRPRGGVHLERPATAYQPSSTRLLPRILRDGISLRKIAFPRVAGRRLPPGAGRRHGPTAALYARAAGSDPKPFIIAIPQLRQRRAYTEDAGRL